MHIYISKCINQIFTLTFEFIYQTKNKLSVYKLNRALKVYLNR